MLGAKDERQEEDGKLHQHQSPLAFSPCGPPSFCPCEPGFKLRTHSCAYLHIRVDIDFRLFPNTCLANICSHTGCMTRNVELCGTALTWRYWAGNKTLFLGRTVILCEGNESGFKKKTKNKQANSFIGWFKMSWVGFLKPESILLIRKDTSETQTAVGVRNPPQKTYHVFSWLKPFKRPHYFYRN